jgi:hypothetical protein
MRTHPPHDVQSSQSQSHVVGVKALTGFKSVDAIAFQQSVPTLATMPSGMLGIRSSRISPVTQFCSFP